jgi:hypothetical protein
LPFDKFDACRIVTNLVMAAPARIDVAPPFQKLIIPDEKRLFLYFSFRVFSSKRWTVSLIDCIKKAMKREKHH